MDPMFHPRFAYLPGALAIVMPMVATGLLVAWWRKWLPPRAWLLAIALQAILLVSAIFALPRASTSDLERVLAPSIAVHRQASEMFVWGGGAVLAVMILALALSHRRAGTPSALVATVGTLVVLWLGYRSGRSEVVAVRADVPMLSGHVVELSFDMASANSSVIHARDGAFGLTCAAWCGERAADERRVR